MTGLQAGITHQRAHDGFAYCGSAQNRRRAERANTRQAVVAFSLLGPEWAGVA